MTVRAHKHIEDTEIGAKVLRGLPLCFLEQPSRGSVLRNTMRRALAVRVGSLRELRSTRARAAEMNFRQDISRSIMHNWARMITAAVLHGVSFRDYFILDMHVAASLRPPKRYFTHGNRHKIREIVNCEQCEKFLHNKILTKRLLLEKGIAQSPAIAFAFNGSFYDPVTLEPFASAQQVAAKMLGKRIILKGATGRNGKENIICPAEVVDIDYAAAYIKATVDDAFQRRPVVIENLITNDASPHGTTNSLNTLRITTWRDADNGIRVIGATQRLATKNDSVDNSVAGGLTARVDIVTGMVRGPFWFKDLGPLPSFELLRSFIVPNWTEVKAAAIKAHECFEGLTSIGWDIASTLDGPLIVEGNHDWDLYMHQRHTKAGFDI